MATGVPYYDDVIERNRLGGERLGGICCGEAQGLCLDTILVMTLCIMYLSLYGFTHACISVCLQLPVCVRVCMCVHVHPPQLEGLAVERL